MRGKVVDRFLDAVLGARVALERSSGGGWTRVSAEADPRGFYSLRAKRRGTYRVTARMAGFTAMSRDDPRRPLKAQVTVCYKDQPATASRTRSGMSKFE